MATGIKTDPDQIRLGQSPIKELWNRFLRIGIGIDSLESIPGPLKSLKILCMEKYDVSYLY